MSDYYGRPAGTGGYVEPRRTRRGSPLGAAVVIGALIVLLWTLEAYDAATHADLDRYGIVARDPDSLDSILYAPFLHAGFEHLAANTVPLVVLGFLLLLSGLGRWFLVTGAAMIGSGLAAWLFSPPFSVTVGASGVVFGWLSYLLVRGFFSGSGRQILLAVVLFLVFGGLLWGVLPSSPLVSWQGHLGGAIGGVVAAWVLDRPSRTPALRR